MADRVLPNVRLLVPCDEAVYDLDGNVWVVRNPRTTVSPPTGADFPFREQEMWVYAQLTGGAGSVDLAVEVRQRRDDGSYRTVGIGPMPTLDFPPQERLAVRQTAFRFRQLPFREVGLYEFRVVTWTGSGSEAIGGPAVELRVLHPRGRV